MTKEFDIIVFGATSFAGQIITKNLMDKYGNDSIKWAIAGRNKAKLTEVKEKCGAQAITSIVCDAADESALTEMVKRTKVVLSTVGPFALYGEPLVKICAHEGTDYCDITGEVQWYKRMLEKYEAKAIETGARIVHCCGFDSIPSDMGVFFLQEEAKREFNEYCTSVKTRVANIRGGASGGTILSMFNIATEAAKDKEVRKAFKNPYYICPENHNYHVRQQSIRGAQFDDDFDAWLGPFIMEAVNSRVVHRSNALLGSRYSNEFEYNEASIMGKGNKGKKTAKKTSFMLKAFMIMAATKPTQWILQRFLPKAGSGPTPSQQKNGFYDLRYLGKTHSGKPLKAKVFGDADPGYGSTAKMVSEAAICLVETPQSISGGFWTPSSLFGQKLIDRLQKNAGLTFEIID